MESTASPAQVLPQGAGWGVVVGIGFAFAGLILGITFIQHRFTEAKVHDEKEFNNAGHSIKPGLIAAGIVSAWTWAATLLQSTTVTFKYGVSGAYWYAAGATLQILLCAIMACRIKSCAPWCSTYLEVLRVRHGKPVHAVFLFFSFATNLLVSSMLVLGGAAVVNQLTGMNTIASLFLIPISVAIYTVTGGLRATLLADYSHTVGLFIVIIYFFFSIWTGKGKIGSLEHMVELINKVAETEGVEGNYKGSYITMRSREGLVFGIINICSNLSAVFCDQSYHQRSIASRPKSAARGFFLGGTAWFPVPFVFATMMGLTARALMHRDPDMAILNDDQVSQGLVAPAAAVALQGKGGAVAMLILLFLAVISASSAQQIAVSSVFTYDVFKLYINPNAGPRQTMLVSHLAVCGWAIVMAVVGIIWNYAGIDLGWLYTMMAIIIAPAVFPIFGSLSWSKTNSTACVVAMISGLVLGIMTWLVTAYGLEGEVTVASLGKSYPTLAGNLVSIMVGTIVTIVWSLISPQNYDFSETRKSGAPADWMERIPEELRDTPTLTRGGSGGETPPSVDDEKAIESRSVSSYDPIDGGEANINYVKAAGLDPADIMSVLRRVQVISISISFILVVVVPAISAAAGVWTPAGLGAWVWLGFLWLCWSIFAVSILPIIEARDGLLEIFERMMGKQPKHHAQL
ncbi:hypothetical protein MCUN1_003395 [Malassezia cuniculi]|uniref:Urea active transporter n=1 Tax=Malassezia cuniculi TaxID=948313 RepID=A0AAF0EXH4_9BASI|nr:hypothetical protein MCUN1_003395 [Malassezia cuniculi]